MVTDRRRLGDRIIVCMRRGLNTIAAIGLIKIPSFEDAQRKKENSSRNTSLLLFKKTSAQRKTTEKSFTAPPSLNKNSEKDASSDPNSSKKQLPNAGERLVPQNKHQSSSSSSSSSSVRTIIANPYKKTYETKITNNVTNRQKVAPTSMAAPPISLQQEQSKTNDAASVPQNTSDDTSARDNHARLQHNILHVSTKQRGNKALNFIRNTPYQFSKITPDYIFSSNRCALFLSVKYHNLHPTYIHRRIKELRRDFDLRVLLLLVDVEDNSSTLAYLNKLAVVNDMTLLLSWSNEEAARYIETFKILDGADASSIKKRETNCPMEKMTEVLTCVKGVNKTDARSLMEQFGGCLGEIMRASVEELEKTPGMGEMKTHRLYDAFHLPFSTLASKRRRRNLEGERRGLAQQAAAQNMDTTAPDEETLIV